MATPKVPAVRWFIADGLAATELLPENAKKALAPYEESTISRGYRLLQKKLESPDPQLAQLLALNPLPQKPIRIFLYQHQKDCLVDVPAYYIEEKMDVPWGGIHICDPHGILFMYNLEMRLGHELAHLIIDRSITRYLGDALPDLGHWADHAGFGHTGWHSVHPLLNFGEALASIIEPNMIVAGTFIRKTSKYSYEMTLPTSLGMKQTMGWTMPANEAAPLFDCLIPINNAHPLAWKAMLLTVMKAGKHLTLSEFLEGLESDFPPLGKHITPECRNK